MENARFGSRDRDFTFTLTRADGDGDGLTFEGYAAVFNTPARIRDQQGEYDEIIAPTAFNQTIRSGKTPIFMFNHGKHPVWADLPIGRITKMSPDARGLFIQARMLSHDFFAPLREAIAEKAIPGMSFRFDPSKGKDEWQTRKGQPPLCTRTELSCPELGPVISPAYVETTASVRSICTALAQSFPEAMRVEILGRSSGGQEGLLMDCDETDKQSLVEDAVAQLWGFDDAGAFNWVEMHDGFMVFGVNNAYVSDHRGLWKVNFTYNNGTLTIEDPVSVQATGYIPTGTAPTDLAAWDPNLNSAPIVGQARANSKDLGTLDEAATGTSGEAAAQVRTGPLTQAERQRQLRKIQLARLTRKKAS